ncbi:uncharacterized protein [Coffea arabica]|uniref:Protein NUCLEAR FUSION DEFECTIVE 6, chloroplastic/mitochondrial-like n=2 Tax=Coffea TaxID=13442 RepID=A0A6P6SKN5_COFAR
MGFGNKTLGNPPVLARTRSLLCSTMASSTSRVLSRLSSRLQPVALKLGGNKKASIPASISSSTASQSAAKRSSWISRLPVELSGAETMLPLHSAIASARLTSSLSIESRLWGLVPQGISLPL